MKQLSIILALLLAFSWNANAQKKREITTPVSVAYTLPRVTYDIVVTLQYTDLIPGPFARYAEQQLGVRPDITGASRQWAVQSVRVIPRPEPDPRAAFTLSAAGEYGGIAISLTPDGLLAGIGNVPAPETALPAGATREETPAADPEPIAYYRFGLRSTLKERVDSNFTMVEWEGEMRRQWDPIITLVPKEEEDYVAEITCEIFNIRQQRLQAAATADAAGIKALDRLERQYMSLFMGRRETHTLVRQFTFTPSADNTSAVLFRFSPGQGITTTNNVAAIPYIIELRDITTPPATPPATTVPSLTYRVPATATLVLLRGEQTAITLPVVVPQLGYFKTFPLDVIHNEGLSIQFHPSYGSLKSVTR